MKKIIIILLSVVVGAILLRFGVSKFGNFYEIDVFGLLLRQKSVKKIIYVSSHKSNYTSINYLRSLVKIISHSFSSV